MDAPPTKRRRTGDATETPLVRSTEYWFYDGNIILQVESTQFRLAKSVLSLHSSVFRDMFMVPLPADEPTVENCPVVILTGDTAQDWIHFLGVIYPKRLVDETPGVELIAAILRLSKKYDFTTFRKDCLRRLKSEFPTTLEEFDDSNDWPLVKVDATMYLPLLALAHEIDPHSILPVIYCSMVTLKGQYMPKIFNPKDMSLSTKDRSACTLGYGILIKRQSATTMAWRDLGLPHPHIPCTTCTQPDKCNAAVKEVIVDMSKRHRPDIWIIDDWDDDWGKNMCRPCRKKAKEVFETGRETCWKELPSAFGLATWEELKALDFE